MHWLMKKRKKYFNSADGCLSSLAAGFQKTLITKPRQMCLFLALQQSVTENLRWTSSTEILKIGSSLEGKIFSDSTNIKRVEMQHSLFTRLLTFRRILSTMITFEWSSEKGSTFWSHPEWWKPTRVWGVSHLKFVSVISMERESSNSSKLTRRGIAWRNASLSTLIWCADAFSSTSSATRRCKCAQLRKEIAQSV